TLAGWQAEEKRQKKACFYSIFLPANPPLAWQTGRQPWQAAGLATPPAPTPSAARHPVDPCDLSLPFFIAFCPLPLPALASLDINPISVSPERKLCPPQPSPR